MKTFQNIAKSILIAATIVLATSCHKDEDAPVIPVTNNANNSFVTAKVDGADFTSYIFGTSAASCTRGGSGNDQFMTVLGGNLGGDSISVVLMGNLAVGTYTINSNSDSILNYSLGSGQAFSTGDCDAASGTITVNASDATHIEGTFSFVGKETDNCGASKTITEGSFKGVYPN